MALSLTPMNVLPCKHCGAYLTTGLQNTVHPHHYASCELFPDNAWPGHVTVKLSSCNYKVGYHADPHHGCLAYAAGEVE